MIRGSTWCRSVGTLDFHEVLNEGELGGGRPKGDPVPVAIGKGRHALPLIYQANERKKAPSSQFAMHSIFSRTKSNNAANYGSTDDFGRVVSQLEPAQYSDGFLPFTTDRPVDVGDATYGYMSYERHIVLHPEQVSVLVDTVSAELGTRGGITAPFIFSSSALDTSSSGVKRLIRTFLDAQISRTPAAEHSWREEAKFASPHNLAMFMRWALARIVRVVDGREERGLVPWEHYTAFRDSEVAANFPPHHFSTFLPSLLPPVRHTVLTVLSVLARLTANSTSSGHTPPTLSPLFGGLFFGLGVQGAPFHHTYVYYLRATNAMEHIILSFIRFQDTAKLGVPTRLKEWIKGYPVMLASQSSRPEPRKGARTVRLVSVRRNVRMYSRDLIRSASTWESELLRSPVRYSDTYRKRMDMPPSFEPEAVGSTMTPGAADQRFRSLTDFKWGEFEELGFGGLGGDDKKLQFDLTESARNQRNVKRQTLSWNDFSSSGFTRTDIAPLMQFTPSPTSPNSTASEIIHGKKLKKPAKLPVFQWDTTPVVGQEEVVEEAFLDVFCDVLCSWPNTEPEEERECNWAMIEFSPSTLLLFEEFVPLEYRQQLISGPSNGRKRLPSLFSSSSPGTPSTKSMNKKSSKKNLAVASSAASVGSRISRNAAAEVEFEGLLRGDGGRKTKVIRLGGTPEIVTSPAPSFPLSKTISPASSSKPQSTPITPSKSSSSTDSRRRFRINTPLSTPRKSIISGIPSEATTVDFETRIASLDSDAYEEYPVVDGGISQQQDEDSWVDILVGSQERRMANQQFVINGKRGAGARGYGGDPDLVSMDVEEAMKGVPRDMSASPEVAEIAPPPRTVFQSLQDDGYGEENDSVEIETVPRRPQSSHSSRTEKSYHRDEIDLGTDDEEDREVRRPKKLGYFDLHPERRPPPSLTSQHDDNDDPRERFHADSDSEDDEVVIRDVTVRALPTVPAIVTPITTPPTGETKSKTASLIEMYREKEKGTAIPIAPSKIPILTTASSSPAKSPSPALAPPEVIPPPVVAIEEGRASPARYVHGAPLHNVLEEEEEE